MSEDKHLNDYSESTPLSDENYCIGVTEAAELLGISQPRLSQITSRGDLIPLRRKIGSRFRMFYRESDIVQYRQKQLSGSLRTATREALSTAPPLEKSGQDAMSSASSPEKKPLNLNSTQLRCSMENRRPTLLKPQYGSAKERQLSKIQEKQSRTILDKVAILDESAAIFQRKIQQTFAQLQRTAFSLQNSLSNKQVTQTAVDQHLKKTQSTTSEKVTELANDLKTQLSAQEALRASQIQLFENQEHLETILQQQNMILQKIQAATSMTFENTFTTNRKKMRQRRKVQAIKHQL